MKIGKIVPTDKRFAPVQIVVGADPDHNFTYVTLDAYKQQIPPLVYVDMLKALYKYTAIPVKSLSLLDIDPYCLWWKPGTRYSKCLFDLRKHHTYPYGVVDRFLRRADNYSMARTTYTLALTFCKYYGII